MTFWSRKFTSVTTQLPCRWEIARKENICIILLVKLYYLYFVQSHISLAVHPHFPASKVYSLQCLGNREGLSDLYVFFVLFSVEKIRQAFTFTAWLQNHFSLLWSCRLLIHMTFFFYELKCLVLKDSSLGRFLWSRHA